MGHYWYHVSEDLARGIASASLLETKMEMYAKGLKEIVEDKDQLRRLNLLDAEYDILDTYAYARMVLEARRANPDAGVFKQMRRILQDVVGKFQERADKSQTREARSALSVARLHYQSARELAGE